MSPTVGPSLIEFPDVDPPIVSVNTELPGVNPQAVESAVTEARLATAVRPGAVIVPEDAVGC